MWHIKPILLSVIFLFPLYGCGGGGGGNSNHTETLPKNESESKDSSDQPSDNTTKSTSLSELKIDPKHSLTSTYQVNLDVSLPHLASAQVYISICHNIGNSLQTVDYRQCLIKAALNAGFARYQLKVPNHYQSLIAVISVMKPNTPPVVSILERKNQTTLNWFIQ